MTLCRCIGFKAGLRIRKSAAFTTKSWWTDHQSQGEHLQNFAQGGTGNTVGSEDARIDRVAKTYGLAPGLTFNKGLGAAGFTKPLDPSKQPTDFSQINRELGPLALAGSEARLAVAIRHENEHASRYVAGEYNYKLSTTDADVLAARGHAIHAQIFANDAAFAKNIGVAANVVLSLERQSASFAQQSRQAEERILTKVTAGCGSSLCL